MARFNPSTIVEDIDGNPIKFGQVDDPAARQRMTELRSEIARALKDAPETVPALEEALFKLVNDNRRSLTLGEAVVMALRTPLKDDEDLGEAAKLDHMDWAVKVRAAQNRGPDETVEFTRDQFARIKERVNRCWPAPEVIWRLNQAAEDAT